MWRSPLPRAVRKRHEIAWLVRHALDAPPARWLGLKSATTGLTVIEYRNGLPPTLVMFNGEPPAGRAALDGLPDSGAAMSSGGWIGDPC